MIVVDASAALDLLLRTERFDFVSRNIAGGEQSVHAPDVLDAEVLGGLRRKVRLGQVESGRAEVALMDLVELPVRLHRPRPLIARAWELRENVAAMDALYLALAETLRAGLLTTDGPLAKAARRHTRVQVIAP